VEIRNLPLRISIWDSGSLQIVSEGFDRWNAKDQPPYSTARHFQRPQRADQTGVQLDRRFLVVLGRRRSLLDKGFGSVIHMHVGPLKLLQFTPAQPRVDGK
jgi:hypothetical protein